jgi:hypothetical protein
VPFLQIPGGRNIFTSLSSVTASFDDGGKDADRAKEDSGRSEAQVIDQVDRPTKTIMASVAQVEVGDGAEAARR